MFSGAPALFVSLSLLRAHCSLHMCGDTFADLQIRRVRFSPIRSLAASQSSQTSPALTPPPVMAEATPFFLFFFYSKYYCYPADVPTSTAATAAANNNNNNNNKLLQPFTIHFGLLGGTVSVTCLTTAVTYCLNTGSFPDQPTIREKREIKKTTNMYWSSKNSLLMSRHFEVKAKI